MSIELFDSHTHLDAQAFDEDREQVIKRAQAVGVTRFLTVGAGGGFQSAQQALELSCRYEFVWAAVGLHPHDAAEPYDADTLAALAANPKAVAIGETGLDFFREWSPRDRQYQWFELHIDTALNAHKPIVVHARAAGRECLNLLKARRAESVGGVFHCYAEDSFFASELRDINFYVSFPGTITFKNAEALRTAARDIPLEQILIETDAPYLAPVPYRGQRCESYQIIETARALAAIKGLSLEDVANQTTANAIALFSIA